MFEDKDIKKINPIKKSNKEINNENENNKKIIIQLNMHLLWKRMILP